MEIKIISTTLESSDLKTYLEKADYKETDVEFELQPKALKLRGVDPTVLIAVIGAASTSLTGLITGIFSVVKEKKLGTVVIESKSGTKIEVPADYSIEKLDLLIQKLNTIDADKIIISK